MTRTYTPCENTECTFAKARKACVYNDLPYAWLRTQCGCCHTKFNHAKYRPRSSSADRKGQGQGRGGPKDVAKPPTTKERAAGSQAEFDAFIHKNYPHMAKEETDVFRDHLANLSAQHSPPPPPQPEHTIGSAKHAADIADRNVNKWQYEITEAESRIGKVNEYRTESNEQKLDRSSTNKYDTWANQVRF